MPKKGFCRLGGRFSSQSFSKISFPALGTVFPARFNRRIDLRSSRPDSCGLRDSPAISSCHVFAADVFVRVPQLQPWLFAGVPRAESAFGLELTVRRVPCDLRP